MAGYTGNDGSELAGGLTPGGTIKALSVDTSGNLNVNATAVPPTAVVSTANSSTTLLAANATFTGTGESVLAYGSVSVEVYSDQASAANGLIVEQSQDNTNWDTQASYSVGASTPFQQTVNITGQYLRVLYTNGGTNQGTFRLQTIKMVPPSPAAGVTNQRVNAHSGDFVAGSIVDLATVAGAVTSSVMQANIKQIGGATPQIDNSHELGVSIYGKNTVAGDTPLLLNSDGSVQFDLRKVLGAAMSVNNPLIDADIIRYALINGTLYALTAQASSAGASSAGIAIYGGNSGISKNTLILSVFGSSIGNQVILKCGTLSALDANVATNTTPTPLKAGGSASLYTGSNAAINAPTGTSNPSYTGSFFRYITEAANVAQELAITGVGLYYIPANTATAGFEAVLVQGSAAGVYALNLIWAEF